MSAAERKLIKQTIVDFSAAYPGQALGMRRVRSELVERGSVFSDPRWNDEMKQIIRDVMEEIDGEENAEEGIPLEKPTKYDTAANKNLAIFMDGISGSSRMLAASDEEDQRGEEEDEEEEEEDDDEVEIVEVKPKKKAASKPKPKATSSKTQYKSAATITTSDDESGAEERRASKQARLLLESAVDEPKKVKAKVERKPKEKVEKKPRARAMKPGDAERGTDAEEEKIKQLKLRCVAVGNPRFFNGSTGAERTLTASERITILDDILRAAGFKRSGALPSLRECQEVGDRRALTKDMQDISGAPVFDTLRTGKKRVNSDEENSDVEAAAATIARKNAPKKKFGAFLGDQSSDSE